MSALVEKVARVLCVEDGESNPDRMLQLDTPTIAWSVYTDEARAAIAAVLAHLADNVSDEMVGAYLQCKPTNPRNIHNAIRESISAALRAAAGSALEAKP